MWGKSKPLLTHVVKEIIMGCLIEEKRAKLKNTDVCLLKTCLEMTLFEFLDESRVSVVLRFKI